MLSIPPSHRREETKMTGNGSSLGKEKERISTEMDTLQLENKRTEGRARYQELA